jgi:hypothetical protein
MITNISKRGKMEEPKNKIFELACFVLFKQCKGMRSGIFPNPIKIKLNVPYILAYKSRNFGPNFNLLFDIRLIRGSTKIKILKIRVRWAGGFTR